MATSSSSNPLSLLALTLLSILLPLAAAQDERDQVLRHCSDTNYTANTPYHTNLKTLLHSLPSKTYINHGFYNFSEGSGRDRAYGIGLCRGDLPKTRCQQCLNESTTYLFQTCPTGVEGVVWSEFCMLRYSNRSILNHVETAPVKHNMNWQNISGLGDRVSPLLKQLRDRAAAGDSELKAAFDNFSSASFQVSVYAYVQCTPDLNGSSCGGCLDSLIKFYTDASIQSYGATIVCPSCQMRFESYQFYEIEANQPPPSSSPPPVPNGNGRSRTRNVLIAVVLAVCLAIAAAGAYIFLRRRNRRKKPPGAEDIESVECVEYDFETIKAATGNFSDGNKVGQGGFGAVYKGRLANGQEIAVKRLEASSGQGDLEFKNEVILAAELQHRNLVKLLGFCLEGRERLLVYELLSASLDQFIFDGEKCRYLDWERRYKIIGGVAKGLQYLHEDSRLSIIHRDLKASNVLLDEEMNPKIADFGMARLFLLNQTRGKTSTIMGTYGYMAPEYALYGQFSVKSDVYSFGVLMLELISGQKNSNFRVEGLLEDLVGFAWKSWEAGTAGDMIDAALSAGPQKEIARCIHIGLLCVQDDETKRPTMSSVVMMLTSFSHALPHPSEPAYFARSSTAPEAPISAEHKVRRAGDIYPKEYSISDEHSANTMSVTEIDPR